MPAKPPCGTGEEDFRHGGTSRSVSDALRAIILLCPTPSPAASLTVTGTGVSQK
jgi:hypothetical protein